MARIKMHILKAKLPFYPSYEVKCRLQNGVSTLFVLTCSLPLVLCFFFFLFFSLLCALVLILSPCLGKLELIGFPLLLLCLALGVSFIRTTVVERLLRIRTVIVRFGLSVL